MFYGPGKVVEVFISESTAGTLVDRDEIMSRYFTICSLFFCLYRLYSA